VIGPSVAVRQPLSIGVGFVAKLGAWVLVAMIALVTIVAFCPCPRFTAVPDCCYSCEQMPKPKVFLSHIHAEEELAKLIQNQLLDTHLLGALDVFVSSDPTTNPGGTSWLNNVEDNLRAAEVLLILASPFSIIKPWINVEAGAGWVRYLQARAAGTEPVSVMPLCHSGLTQGQLPLPWSTFNAVEIRTEGGLHSVLDTCARAAKIRSPRPNLAAIATEVQRLESFYTKFRDVERRLRSVVAQLGCNVSVLKTLPPPPNQLWAVNGVPQSVLMSAELDLLWLVSEGHILYSQGTVRMMLGGLGGGTSVDIGVAPTANFIANVLPHLAL
jgi:hypothetical protein